jgi:hypothetical protein
MPQKSKTVKRKAASIAKAHTSGHPSRISDSVLVPDPEMNNTTMPEMTPSPGLKIIRDLDNEEINEEITLEGPRDSPMGLEGSWDHLDLSEAKINLYFEFEDEDEQGYVREGEELEDIYEDRELSELEGEELEKNLKLVMEDEMERMEQRKRDQELTPYETVMQGVSASDWRKAESKRGLGYSGPPAARTEREHRQKAREAEKTNKKIRKG